MEGTLLSSVDAGNQNFARKLFYCSAFCSRVPFFSAFLRDRKKIENSAAAERLLPFFPFSFTGVYNGIQRIFAFSPVHVFSLAWIFLSKFRKTLAAIFHPSAIYTYCYHGCFLLYHNHPAHGDVLSS